MLSQMIYHLGYFDIFRQIVIIVSIKTRHTLWNFICCKWYHIRIYTVGDFFLTAVFYLVKKSPSSVHLLVILVMSGIWFCGGDFLASVMMVWFISLLLLPLVNFSEANHLYRANQWDNGVLFYKLDWSRLAVFSFFFFRKFASVAVILSSFLVHSLCGFGS